jgi:hypothetical protein
MKMSKIKFNEKTFMLIWLIIPAFLLSISSCNSSSNNNNDEADIQELERLVIKEKQHLKYEIDSIVADFNDKVNRIEAKVDAGSQELSIEAEETLKDLKAERDTLSMRFKEIGYQTQQNWKEFKKELEHDTEQFTSSVADFFKDNA